jgi:hypothetical protein
MISRSSEARIGDAKTLMASACPSRAALNAPETASLFRTSKTWSFRFKARAASSDSVTCALPVVGSQSAATRDILGTNSFSNSNLFALSSGERMVKPVIFAPGCARLATRPAPTISSQIATIGIVSVACCATLGARSPNAVIRQLVGGLVPQQVRELSYPFLSITKFDRNRLTFDVTELAKCKPK